MSAPPADVLITDGERVRRLAALPEVRPQWLSRLHQARIAVVGVGGLGSSAAQYLAAQGIGHVTLIDGDVVDASNLGRQVLFCPSAIGKHKVEVAARALQHIAPRLSVRALPEFLGPESLEHLSGHDIVIDGLDRAEPRELLNAWAVRNGVPVIFGGAVGYEGQVFVVLPGGPCLSCLWPSLQGADENCVTGGILGPLVGAIGALQAAEGIKWLVGVAPQPGMLLSLDLLQGRMRSVMVPRNPDCHICGKGRADAQTL